MKRKCWMALVFIVALGFIVPPAISAESASGEQLQQVLFVRLLLDPDSRISRLGTQSIALLPDGDAKQSLSDLVAEHLIAVADPNPELKPDLADSVGWHVNVLMKNVGRYRLVLGEARKRYAHPRVLDRIDNALQSTDAAPVEEYKIRNVDFAPIKADVDRQWAAGRRQDRGDFAKLGIGARLGTVLAKLGSPDDVTPTTIRVARYGSTQMLSFHYAKAGMVLFNLSGAVTREWQAYEFIDELFDVTAVYSGEGFGMAQAVAGLRGPLFRDYLIYNGRRLSKLPGFLPVLEQRLLSAPQPSDKFERDAMLRCVAFIYRYGSSEAMEALRRVDKGSTDERVQKEARGLAAKLQKRATAEAEHESESESDDEAADQDAA